MATAVYSLCALTSAGCAFLLGRLFLAHRGRTTRLVLWSSLSFGCFAISNALVFVDLVIVPGGQFAVARAATATLAAAVLLVGLIWESE